MNVLRLWLFDLDQEAPIWCSWISRDLAHPLTFLLKIFWYHFSAIHLKYSPKAVWLISVHSITSSEGIKLLCAQSGCWMHHTWSCLIWTRPPGHQCWYCLFRLAQLSKVFHITYYLVTSTGDAKGLNEELTPCQAEGLLLIWGPSSTMSTTASCLLVLVAALPGLRPSICFWRAFNLYVPWI